MFRGCSSRGRRSRPRRHSSCPELRRQFGRVPPDRRTEVKGPIGMMSKRAQRLNHSQLRLWLSKATSVGWGDGDHQPWTWYSDGFLESCRIWVVPKLPGPELSSGRRNNGARRKTSSNKKPSFKESLHKKESTSFDHYYFLSNFGLLRKG